MQDITNFGYKFMPLSFQVNPANHAQAFLASLKTDNFSLL